MPQLDGNVPKTQLLTVPTLYDVAHRAGLTTAQVAWVAIKDAPTIDWSLDERPSPDDPIAREMIAAGEVTLAGLSNFANHSGAWKDFVHAKAAVHILRSHHPDLLLVHLGSVDEIQHAMGFGTEAAYNTVGFVDYLVAQIWEAVRQNGDLKRTVFVIVSDHGQESYHHIIRPNVLLADAGLQVPLAKEPTFAFTNGGFALVYQKNATSDSINSLKALFMNRSGIRSVLTAHEAAQFGWPSASSTTQVPDLVLYAQNDYAFELGASGEFESSCEQRGSHGYPNSEPSMQAIFIASGAGVRVGVPIPPISILDVAPTVARILGLDLPNTQGRALSEILR